MHMVIRAIVYAEAKDEALEQARGVFERLCGENGPFDFFVMFDEDSAIAGKTRWGKLPVAALTTSKAGQQLIKQGMDFTRQEFLRNLAIIRRVLKKKSNLQIFRQGYDREMFRHRCYRCGHYAGSSIWLYDDDGAGIQTPEQLKTVLNKWKCLYEDKGKENPYKDLKLWVVPADVHC